MNDLIFLDSMQSGWGREGAADQWALETLVKSAYKPKKEDNLSPSTTLLVLGTTYTVQCTNPILGRSWNYLQGQQRTIFKFYFFLTEPIRSPDSYPEFVSNCFNFKSAEIFKFKVHVCYHCGGWSEEVNSCILNSHMVYL